MARSKQRTRKRKRRGTQAGTVKQSPRSRGSSRSKATPKTAEERRLERLNRPPSWTRSIGMGVVTSIFLFVVFMLFFKRDLTASLTFAGMALLLYVPVFYFADSFKYTRHQRRLQREREQAKGGES